jgi:uncharacterized protein YndB with AHSA1/START domain
MSTDTMPRSARSTQTAVEIAAPPETVWRALTDPTEIVRWFALSAEVEPRIGGTVTWRWQDTYVWPSRIEIWEPARHLRLAYMQLTAADAKSPRPAAAEVKSAYELVMDFQLEAVGGATALRLVHSGFGRDSSWDDEYDGVRRGWIVELASLKHYVERHLGEKRRVLWVFVRTGLTAANAWARLVGGPGDTTHFVRDSAAGTTVHPRAQLETPVVVIRDDPGADIVACVPSWNDSLLRVSLYRTQGRTTADVFISLYGAPSAFGTAPPTRDDLVDIMRRAFPEQSSELVVMGS